jgi:hypothetical protein
LGLEGEGLGDPLFSGRKSMGRTKVLGDETSRSRVPGVAEKDGMKLAGLGELSDAEVGCGVAGEEENGEGDEGS